MDHTRKKKSKQITRKNYYIIKTRQEHSNKIAI